MEKIKVRLKTNPYSILIGNQMSDEIKKYITKNHPKKRLLMITDDKVDTCVLPYFDLASEKIIIPSGESSKNIKTIIRIWDTMQSKKYGRDTLLIAIGGGVVGDITGFIASTYNRGIPYIQVPTTLLAACDSSIGGKTGIDTSFGKNMIGTFYQPTGVFIDVSFLKTLPYDEMKNGLAECLKHGLIKDKKLFLFIKNKISRIMQKDPDTLISLIQKNCNIKSDIIVKDEQDTGIRQILNFGHTIGHAIEKLSDFKISHGQAVSIGMVCESKISKDIGLLSEENFHKIQDTIQKCNMPYHIPKNINSKNIIDTTKADKKTKQGSPGYIILENIGKTAKKYIQRIDDKIIRRTIDGFY